MSDNQLLHWEPLISVGPFKFNTPIQRYIDLYGLQFVEAADEVVGWDTYATSDEKVFIDVEDSSIVAISCYECFFYKGKNLIGLPLPKVRALLGNESEIGDQLGEKIPIEYADLGLQLWMKDNYVTNVTSNGFIES